jgi:hypothetical protein
MFDFREINWGLLREQKLAILELRADMEKLLGLEKSWLENPERVRGQAEALSGIIHLIDYIQDSAVDSGEYTKDEVFALPKEPE